MGTHDVAVSGTVPLEPHRAFDLFTVGIGEWWRDYWNDERATGIRFEDQGPKGRLIELWGDEGQFEIGRVTAWRTGRELAFTWREAGWPAGESTDVAISFEPSDGGTQVTLGHRGWGGLSEPNAGEGYDSGWEELLGWYAQAAAARGTG